MKRLLWILIIFVVLPIGLTPIIFKFAAQPIVNWLLQSYVNAPAKVEKVETNWWLTEWKLQGLEINQPPNFGKGPMLVVPNLELNLLPSVYWNFGPYGTLKVENFYLHYKEKDGVSNMAEAFGLKVEPSKEKGSKEFKLKEVNANATFLGMSNVKYSANGLFEGFHNNAKFIVNGTADVKRKETVADFKVFNWVLRNQILQTLTGKPEIVLTKIDGRVKVSQPWVYFVDRSTKLYTVGDILFAEIYPNSKYNYLTKELDIKGAVYLPVKTEFTVKGTVDKPQIRIENIQSLQIKLPSNELLKGQAANQTKGSNDLKQKLDKTLKESAKKLEDVLKNLFH